MKLLRLYDTLEPLLMFSTQQIIQLWSFKELNLVRNAMQSGYTPAFSLGVKGLICTGSKRTGVG